MKTPSTEQMRIVALVAAKFWQVPLDQVVDQIDTIEVVKFTGGKVSGFLPAHSETSSVFFKVYTNNAFRFEQAGLEAAALMPKIEGVSTPTVLAMMPEYKAVIMKKRTWEDTDSPWKRLWVNRLGINWYNVGAWLRVFHDTQVTNERNNYFLRRKYEKFESHIADLKHLFNLEQLQKMDQIYQSAREYFEKETTEWVLSHGDFGLANIKKTSNELEIIDFEDCQPAPRAFDIINLIARLEHYSYVLHSHSAFDEFTEKFLEGYNKQVQQNVSTKFIYLLIKLDMIETYYRRKNTATNLITRSVFSYYQYGVFKSLTARLKIDEVY